jgi:MFS transporter, YNFM family, putative membrane transport protein
LSESTFRSSLNYSIITLILLWCGLVVMSSMYLTIPLTAIFSTLLNVSSNEAVWTSSIFAIFFAIGCLFYGPLSDRYGRKKIIMIGLILLTIVTPMVGLFNNIYWIISLRAIQGAIAATFSPVALIYIAEMFPDNRKVHATGFLVTGFLMAGIVGQVISSSINQYLSWNYIFYIMGIVYLFTTIIVIGFLPKDNLPRFKRGVLEAVNKLGSLCKVKSLLLCYFVDITLLMSMMCMYTALGYYLSGPEFGLNSQQILYVRAVGIFGILFAATSGLLVNKFGVFTVLISGLIISAVSLIMLGMVYSIVTLVILSVIFVAGIAITAPALISIIGQIGGKERGSALSLHTVILFIGAGLGPILAINLLNTGIESLPYLIAGFILIISVITSLFIKKSINKDLVKN